ncbi:hypothetical protein Pst134EA_025891 [Puccinia striiformis f. sp. tritici]|uniref:hypothetical protein n=1 Tax=Puccinia striiformis f. sp. tritici TaxID=168172 RepID=UPI000A126F55|nr:hypothetical protein Pst134EA_025891 [Puccinia striiformis f. sp. tritici]KAH9451952.1 hypothetical protein Pst134EA_025891 [Puccinia striiformis f. sp. tritici]KAI9615150.1 hypothetical protein H4Q26_011691 [Puccinia striiformis f. sp. tritici PST-130]
MQFLSISGFVSLLVTLPLNIVPTAASSLPKLTRRNHGHAPFTSVYIMRQEFNDAHAPLKIYAENGKVEYQFSKTTDEFRGVTTSTLLDCSSKPVLALQSEHDVCKQRTTYHQADLPGCPASQRRQIEVYPNGPLTDVWRVNYVDADDHRHNFKFDREFASKDGNIYTQVRGKDGEMVAMLKSERRSDLWLTAGTNADDAATYTLFCTDAAPKLDLIALMGSVFTRVHDCGL